jgi:hypothetical protein
MENLIDLLRHMNKKIDELLAEVIADKQPIGGYIGLTIDDLNEHMKALRAWQVIFNNHDRIMKRENLPSGVIDQGGTIVGRHRIDWWPDGRRKAGEP